MNISHPGPTAVILRKLLEANVGSETTYCQFIASLVFGHWQGNDPWAMGYPPSYLLVNASGHADPCLDIPRAGFKGDLPVPGQEDEELAPGLTLEGAEATMIHLIRQKAQRGDLKFKTTTEKIGNAADRETWDKCQKVYFGSKRTARYGTQHAKLGLPSNPCCRTSLFVESPAEVAALMKDMKKHGTAFWEPWGYGTDFTRLPYATAIMGSIGVQEWTSSLVDTVVDCGAPVLFLPHVPVASSPVLTAAEVRALYYAPFDLPLWANSGLVIPTPEQLPRIPSILHKLLRNFLQDLPPTYDYYVQSMVRHAAARIDCIIAQLILPADHEVICDWAARMRILMFEATVRGILFGLRLLTYHCRSLWLAPHQVQLARSFMVYLRCYPTRPQASFSKQFSQVQTADRDEVLAALTKAGLIEQSQRSLRAPPLAEFIQSLPSARFVPPRTTWHDIDVGGHTAVAVAPNPKGTKGNKKMKTTKN